MDLELCFSLLPFPFPGVFVLGSLLFNTVFLGIFSACAVFVVPEFWIVNVLCVDVGAGGHVFCDCVSIPSCCASSYSSYSSSSSSSSLSSLL